MEASVCVRWIRRYLSYMSQSWCCAGCGTWNWGSRSSCHYCGQAPRTSNGNSWVQVAKKGKTSGKGKGVHTKQQYNGAQAVNSPDAYANGEKLASMKQLHAQIAAVSKALTELEASEDKELMQPLESRLADLKARLHGTRPIGQQVDGLRGVISRCHKRLAEAEIAKAEAEAAIIKETEDIASYRTQLAELEPLLTTSTVFRRADEPNNGMPEWVASTLSSIAKHMLESSTIDREAVAQSLLGLMVPAPPPALPDAQQNGVSNNIIDMCDVASRGNKHEGGADWPQNTNKVRLTTKTMIEEKPQLEDIRTRRRSGMSDS